MKSSHVRLAWFGFANLPCWWAERVTQSTTTTPFEDRPDLCAAEAVEYGCRALSLGVDSNFGRTEWIRRTLSARQSSNRDYWDQFFEIEPDVYHDVVREGNQTEFHMTCTDLCLGTVSYARKVGLVLPNKTDVGCRLVNFGRDVMCDQDASAEHISTFIPQLAELPNFMDAYFFTHFSTMTKRTVVMFSKWAGKDGKFLPATQDSWKSYMKQRHAEQPVQVEEIKGHQHLSTKGHQNLTTERVPDTVVDGDNLITYQSWSFAMRLLNFFRIYPVRPLLEEGPELNVPTSMLEAASMEGTATGGWYDQAMDANAKAKLYMSYVMQQYSANKVFDEFSEWFGGKKNFRRRSAHQKVTQVLNSISNKFDAVEYVFDSTCSKRTYAYVCPKCGECNKYSKRSGDCTYYVDRHDTRIYVVLLCNLWLKSPMQEKIETLIHEASHHRDAFTEDVCLKPIGAARQNCKSMAYERSNCKRLSRSHGDYALSNADNYCYFAFDVGQRGSRKPTCPRTPELLSQHKHPDGDGDCKCKTGDCFQGGKRGCECSEGETCRQYFLPDCQNCECTIPTTTTTTRRKKVRTCPGFEEGAEGTIENKFPDHRGDCKCKTGATCTREVSEGREEGCPFSDGGLSPDRFDALCDACSCDPVESGAEEVVGCGQRGVVAKDPDKNGDCKCKDGRTCWQRSYGILKKGCETSDGKKDKQQFEFMCTDCYCKKNGRKRYIIRGPIYSSRPHRTPVSPCKGGGTLQEQDCVCKDDEYCADSRSHPHNYDMCKASDGQPSMTMYSASESGTYTCYPPSKNCKETTGHVADDYVDSGGNCKCAWGYTCYTGSEPGCVSFQMPNDNKFFLPGIASFNCRMASNNCAKDGATEFADENGDCFCKVGKCWTNVENGKKPGCQNSGRKRSKRRFSQTCENCECLPEEPRCPSISQTLLPAYGPDHDGDCKCGAGSLCRIKNTTDGRCKAADGTSEEHEYFSLTCQNCECYTQTCLNGIDPGARGVCDCPPRTNCYEDGKLGCEVARGYSSTQYYAVCKQCACLTRAEERSLFAVTTPAPKKQQVDPCDNWKSSWYYGETSCGDVVEGAEIRKNDVYNFWRSQTCKCKPGYTVIGKRSGCTSDGRYFDKKDLRGLNCCCRRET